MNVVIADDVSHASQIVADAVDELLSSSRDSVLGLAAGRTFEEAYGLIVERHPPVAGLTAFVLDEYCGLGQDDVHSFWHQVRVQLTDELGVSPLRLRSLDGAEADVTRECDRFEADIAALGGVDLQLLGLGRNGHIAFNEPGSRHDSRSRLVKLDEETRLANAPAFGDGGLVPTHALTQGIGTILEARRIVLMATGAHKADAVVAAVRGPVTERVPASALQTHPDVTVVLDPEAAALLSI